MGPTAILDAGKANGKSESTADDAIPPPPPPPSAVGPARPTGGYNAAAAAYAAYGDATAEVPPPPPPPAAPQVQHGSLKTLQCGLCSFTFFTVPLAKSDGSFKALLLTMQSFLSIAYSYRLMSLARRSSAMAQKSTFIQKDDFLSLSK